MEHQDKSLLGDLIHGKTDKIMGDLAELATPHNLAVVEDLVKHHDVQHIVSGVTDLGGQVTGVKVDVPGDLLPKKSTPINIPKPKRPAKRSIPSVPKKTGKQH